MSGSGFEEEPNAHRSGAADVNVKVDTCLEMARRRYATETGQFPFYPPPARESLQDYPYGIILARHHGHYVSDPALSVIASMAGAGAEENALYPNNPEMVKAALYSSHDIIGVAATSFIHGLSVEEEGLVASVGGIQTIPMMSNERFEPGQIVRAALPEADGAYGVEKSTPSGVPHAGYYWRPAPEDYQIPGNLLLTHLNEIYKDNDKWRAIMTPSGDITTDKWLYTARAETDSNIMTVLIGCYVLLKMGYLKTSDAGIVDPYSDRNEITVSGGIQTGMTPEEFCIKMAELLGTQPISDSTYSSVSDQIYFSSLRRRISLSILYNGSDANLEFGFNSAESPRDTQTGIVDQGKPAGLFLHNQLNHIKKRVSSTLQALDEHTSKRLGTVMSAPNRRKRVTVLLHRS